MDQDRFDANSGFFSSLIGDGRPLLGLVGICLVLAGGFALFLSASGHFLPQDVQFLGMDKDQLCGLDQCRIVHFMFHDRVSFGGTLIAVGSLNMWMTEFPLRQGQAWAWWLFVVSGLAGFASFLTYLGYGYLDTWHGLATLALLPMFAIGLVRSYRPFVRGSSIRSLLKPGLPVDWKSLPGLGRICLCGVGIGLIGAGATIMTVGMTRVFVPTDLEFMGASRTELAAINPRLIPLIAH